MLASDIAYKTLFVCNRFGKRNEVTQDNFIPMYGDEELKDSTLGATGDSYPVVPPLLFVP